MTVITLGLAGVSVMLAMPTHRDLSPYTVRSLLATQEALMRRGQPFTMEVGAGSSLVHHARSKLAWDFLKSDCNRLFWVDSDIEWEARDFLRVLAMSTAMPVVCAAYSVKRDPPEFLISPLAVNENVETNEYGCIRVAGVGLGFACIDRKVIQILADDAPRVTFPDVPDSPIPHIFRCDTFNGYARGEDMAFFSDVRAAGFDVWLDPNVEIGHIGPKTYRASIKQHLVASPTPAPAETSDAA